MKSNFDLWLRKVLQHEGGWADHPNDPGGATMRGVTIGTFAQFKGRKVTKDELRNISDADLRAIYRRKYWDVIRGDDLPFGVDYATFDAAVNSGPSRGARWLQQSLAVEPDGKVGPITVDAAAKANPRDVIERSTAARLSFLRMLKTWPTFGRGWQRRVDDVRADAIQMIPRPPFAAPPLAPKPVDGSEAPPPPAPQPGFLAALAARLRKFFA